MYDYECFELFEINFFFDEQKSSLMPKQPLEKSKNKIKKNISQLQRVSLLGFW